jgi:hypothetical protein
MGDTREHDSDGNPNEFRAPDSFNYWSLLEDHSGEDDKEPQIEGLPREIYLRQEEMHGDAELISEMLAAGPLGDAVETALVAAVESISDAYRKAEAEPTGPVSAEEVASGTRNFCLRRQA